MANIVKMSLALLRAGINLYPHLSVCLPAYLCVCPFKDISIAIDVQDFKFQDR